MSGCLCPVETLTTYSEHYGLVGTAKFAGRARERPSSDQELISGHNENNLQMNGLPIKSEVWPNKLPQSEEYKNFLERLQRCKKDIFNLYFKDPPVNYSVAEEMFKNLSKTAYQLLFSPNVFEPTNEARRFAKENSEVVDMKYQETTQKTYFSRIQELERFRDALYGVIVADNRKELKNELQAIYRCGTTTYSETISQPAQIYAKPTLPRPIDRYTCRRT